jgi:hypothetical protein
MYHKIGQKAYKEGMENIEQLVKILEILNEILKRFMWPVLTGKVLFPIF